MRLSDPTFGDLADLRKKMLVWAKCMDRANAEDLVQCALLKMIAGRHMAPTVLSQVEPWARVVLLNEFRMARRRAVQFVPIDDVLLTAVENPERQTYARQVIKIALGLDAAFLLDVDPDSQERGATSSDRSRRFRARKAVNERVAA